MYMTFTLRIKDFDPATLGRRVVASYTYETLDAARKQWILLRDNLTENQSITTNFNPK